MSKQKHVHLYGATVGTARLAGKWPTLLAACHSSLVTCHSLSLFAPCSSLLPIHIDIDPLAGFPYIFIDKYDALVNSQKASFHHGSIPLRHAQGGELGRTAHHDRQDRSS